MEKIDYVVILLFYYKILGVKELALSWHGRSGHSTKHMQRNSKGMMRNNNNNNNNNNN